MKFPPIPTKHLVWVRWSDAGGGSDRAYEDSLSDIKLSECVNIGWVAHEDDTRIILAHGTCSTNEIDRFVIPKSAIIELRPVVAPRKPRKGAPRAAPQGTNGSH